MERKLKQEGISEYVWLIQGFPAGLNRKESCLQFGRPGFHPWVGKTAWRIPRREEPGGLQSMGSQRVGDG